jgi:hypothetical protein
VRSSASIAHHCPPQRCDASLCLGPSSETTVALFLREQQLESVASAARPALASGSCPNAFSSPAGHGESRWSVRAGGRHGAGPVRSFERSSLLAHVPESREWFEGRLALTIVDLWACLARRHEQGPRPPWPGVRQSSGTRKTKTAKAAERLRQDVAMARTRGRKTGSPSRNRNSCPWSTRLGPDRHGATLRPCCRCGVASLQRGGRRRRRMAERLPTWRFAGNQGPDEATAGGHFASGGLSDITRIALRIDEE